MSINFEKKFNIQTDNNDEEKFSCCETEILEKYDNIFSSMRLKHPNMLQVHFELRYPQDGSVKPMPEHLHDFNYNIKRSLGRKKVSSCHDVDPQLMWVREQEEGEDPHYHHLLLANGDGINNLSPIVQKAEGLWCRTIGSDLSGLVHYCGDTSNGVLQENGIMVRKGHASELEQVDKCYQQASCLAKKRDRIRKVKGLWACGSSRIKSK